MPEQLTRAFQDARVAAGITGTNPPTFHEIRSLGGALLSEAGWQVEQVEGLMGHSSARMTQHYLELLAGRPTGRHFGATGTFTGHARLVCPSPIDDTTLRRTRSASFPDRYSLCREDAAKHSLGLLIITTSVNFLSHLTH